MTYNTELPPGITIPVREPGEPASAFADRVRQVMRRTAALGGRVWKQVYEAALQDAYRRGDMEGFTAMASLAAVGMEAEGRHEEAIQHLDFAISMANEDPDPSTHLMGGKAVYEALLGRRNAARKTARDAGRFAALGTQRAQVGHQTIVGIVDCIGLQRVALPTLTATIAAAARGGFDAQSSALQVWMIPYLVATGQGSVARPWTEALRVQARAVGHGARILDAAVFAYAEQLAAHRTGQLPVLEAIEERAFNPNAEWREHLLALRVALLLADWERADELARQLGTESARFPTGFPPSANPFAALVGAYRGDGTVVGLPVPSHVTLANLGAVLAGMEAVAIAGSQHAAADWIDQTAGLVPPIVQTCLEWPVMAARLRGLLHVRAGAVRVGATLIRRAVEAAGGNAIEAAVGQLQLSEVLTLGQVPASRLGEARALHRDGWAALTLAGIPPMHIAYAASRAVALYNNDQMVGNLTPREAEVLSLLSTGLTYRQIGERLDISWRTAQLHVARIYAKLGVHGRLQAVEAARELHIL